MTAFEEAVLFDCLEAARAWELLHDPSYVRDLDAEGLLELCKAAGLDEDSSQRLASDRAMARMRQGLPA